MCPQAKALIVKLDAEKDGVLWIKQYPMDYAEHMYEIDLFFEENGAFLLDTSYNGWDYSTEDGLAKVR
ncbi:MAG: hypothetical protein KGS48_15185, partial [Bacteroidetes bacterium]|nr:hypothetical protein [Bacteroidota bacterium]